MGRQEVVSRLAKALLPLLVPLLAACTTYPKGVPAAPYYYAGDLPMWARIFSAKEAMASPSGECLAAIAPHHDIDILSLGSFYRALSGHARPSAIVLVSPDHFEAGRGDIVYPGKTRFSVPEGSLAPDPGLGASLARSGAAVLDEGPWPMEHGVFTHTPFLAHYFPAAAFLPLLVRPGASAEAIARLVEALDEALPPDSLVIGSVDFSHYQVRPVARLHDLSSEAAIGGFELQDLSRLEVDSPETLAIVMGFADRRGARRGELLAATNSADLLAASRPAAATQAVEADADAVETTSHQYWVFPRGEGRPRRQLSLFVPGAMRPGLGLGLRRSWSWDRAGTSSEAGVRALSRLAGKEARFLMGFDLCLFDLPPGDEVVAVHGLDVLIRCRQAGQAIPRARPVSPAGLDILVLEGSWADPRGLLLEALAAGHDLALWRGDGDAWLAMPGPQGRASAPRLVELGVFYSPDRPMAGKLALLGLKDGRWDLLTYDYSSADGIPPAIHQFGGEP